MKRTVAKTFKIIFIVLAVVLLIIAALLYLIDAPVVDEGQEPTVAHKLILLGKEHLSKILLAGGTSGIGLLGVFAKLIYNSVKKGLDENVAMSLKIVQLESKLEENNKTIASQQETITVMSKKQDIANNLMMTIFSLSELPASLREKIHTAQTEYNGLDGTTKAVKEVLEIVNNTDENVVETVSIEATPITEMSEEQPDSAPVYL